MGDYKLIPISGKNGVGKFAKVDPENYLSLSQYKWGLDRHGYAYRLGAGPDNKRCTFKMHRVVAEAQPGQTWDHINNDRLDNRRANLRPCTTKQNGANRTTSQGGTSRFKGVYLADGKWRAGIKVDGKKYFIGSFDDEVLAAQAYDACARFYFGEFARANFEGTEARTVDSFKQETRQRQTSKYIGVRHVPTAFKRKWQVSIRTGGRKAVRVVYNKFFLTELEAACAYDTAAQAIFGDKARLNFPNGSPV